MTYLLYSKSQKAFHRDNNLDDMIESNLFQLKRGCAADYVVIGYALPDEDASIKFAIIKEVLGRP